MKKQKKWRLRISLVTCLVCLCVNQAWSQKLYYQFTNSSEDQDEIAFISKQLENTIFTSEEDRTTKITSLHNYYVQHKHDILQSNAQVEFMRYYYNIKEIKRENKAKLWAGIATGVAVAATATAAGVTAAKQHKQEQSAQQEAQRQANMAALEQVRQQQAITASNNTHSYTFSNTNTNVEDQELMQKAAQLARSTSDKTKDQMYYYNQLKAEKNGTTQRVNVPERIVQGAFNYNGVMTAAQLKVGVVNNKILVTDIKLNMPNGQRDWIPVNAGCQSTSFQYDGELSKDYNSKFLYGNSSSGYITIYFNY